MLKKVEGTIIRGKGYASGKNSVPGITSFKKGLLGTISQQRKFFEKEIPNFKTYFNGTINMGIAPRTFKITNPDYHITCNWALNLTESFDLLNVRVSYQGSSYPGLIYFPCPSEIKAHKINDMFELITERIPGIKYGNSISISYDDEKLKLMT